MKRMTMAIAALMIGSIGGCKSSNAPADRDANATAVAAAASTDQGSGFTAKTTGGSYVVSINPPPSQMPLNELFALRIHVLDAATKQPAIGVSVSADAAMPQHRHGMNTSPKTMRNADDTFTTRGMMLHMPGYWEVYVDVTRNGLTERAVIEVELD